MVKPVGQTSSLVLRNLPIAWLLMKPWLLAQCAWNKLTQYLLLFLFVISVSVWADNADACSVQYAGTGALKTDFTRSVRSRLCLIHVKLWVMLSNAKSLTDLFSIDAQYLDCIICSLFGKYILNYYYLFCYRTGKRSTFGLLKDGVNSCIRYYRNNFADGFRQVSDWTR